MPLFGTERASGDGVATLQDDEWMSGEAATRGSQRLAHASTARDVGGLNFRVRDGYGCVPAALAAFMPTDGIEPSYTVSVLQYRTYVRSR